MTPKEIRKLQRNKRSESQAVREAIKTANAVGFSAPTRIHRRDGSPGELRWAERWSAAFEEARVRFAAFSDADWKFFFTGHR